MALLNPGITPANEGDGGTVWDILGQTYFMKESCDSSFAFEVHGLPGTFVPPHIHPTQDEFILVLDGEMELTLDGRKHVLARGGLARMPMGMPHGYANAGSGLVKSFLLGLAGAQAARAVRQAGRADGPDGGGADLGHVRGGFPAAAGVRRCASSRGVRGLSAPAGRGRRPRLACGRSSLV